MTDLMLPPLDEDCPHCTGPAADAERKANAKAWRVWNSEESKAFEAFTAERRARGNVNVWDPEAWERSETYRELKAHQPEELPEKGCVECDWIGRRPTAAGRQVLEFLARQESGL